MAKIKDEHPQQLVISVTESTVNTWTVAEVSTPILQNVGDNTAIVMEILGVDFTLNPPDVINVTDTSIRAFLLHQTKASEPTLTDSDVIHRQVRRSAVIDTAATDATVVIINEADTRYVPLSSGGKGILHARKSIYLGIVGSNNSAAKEAVARILYRLVTVSAQELVGMLAD